MSTVYALYFGTDPDNLSLIQVDIDGLVFSTPGIPLAYDTTYYWRTDAINEFGTTTGTTWSFSTLEFDPPHGTYRYRADGSLVPDGTAYGADTMYITGENFINVKRRLIAAAANAIFYEDTDT